MTIETRRLEIIRNIAHAQEGLANLLDEVAFDDEASLSRWPDRIGSITKYISRLGPEVETLRYDIKQREEAANAT